MSIVGPPTEGVGTPPEPDHNAEDERRWDHVAYRINSGFSYQETPCFCPARQSHSVLDTITSPPAKPADRP